MEHVHRHGILGPIGLLTPKSVLSATLIGGIVVLLAGQSAYTQVWVRKQIRYSLVRRPSETGTMTPRESGG